MAWSASGIFRQPLIDALDGTQTQDLDSNSIKVALFNNSVTPDFDAASSATAYGGGTWASNEVVDSSGAEWPAGGVALAAQDLTGITGGLKFDANDVSVASTSLSNVYGLLVYNDTASTPVANIGLLAVYFGGTAYTTVDGTFAITWNASGIFTLDLTP